MKLGNDFLSRETVEKSLGLLLGRIWQGESKHTAENESLLAGKQENIGIPMILLRPKRFAKESKKPIEHIEEQYPDLAIHI